MKKALKVILVTVSVLLVICIVFISLVLNGTILLNRPDRERFVTGIDVSAYQGEIDWKTLSAEDIFFVFIKATEGSTFVDEKFDYNFKEAAKTSLAVGAYHFFSYDSSGKTQAENFISNVTPFKGMLPPVIDLEFYGDKADFPPQRDKVEKELKTMLTLLEEHYGQKPVIYATEKSYDLYLSDDYKEYDIWIRNVISKPKLSDDRNWTFWQFTNRERLDGYKGEEKYIDMNIFNGDTEKWSEYLKKNTY